MRKPAFSFREIQARISCAIAKADWHFYLSVPLWPLDLKQCSISVHSFVFCVVKNVEGWISHDVDYIMFARLLFVCLYDHCIILYIISLSTRRK